MTAPEKSVKQVPFYEKRPYLLHGLLFSFIFVYAFIGGIIFRKLEGRALIKVKEEEYRKNFRCIMSLLQNDSFQREHSDDIRAFALTKCGHKELDERSKWNYITATLYGFGIITTLGYNRIAPVTDTGRIFCVLYGICGIPITMVIIATFGQRLKEATQSLRNKYGVLSNWRRDSISSQKSQTSSTYSNQSTEKTSIRLLVMFLIYISSGAVLLPFLHRGEFDFINGLYYNFLCLTAIDFGALVPPNIAYLPITFAYVCVGLAITTIVIDVGSDYMRKLHNIGKKVKNVGNVRIWFGGKTLKVKELLYVVGKKCGIDPLEIDKLDLDNVVERAIAINEGRDPPDDTNLPPDPDPCPPYSPELDKEISYVDNISQISWKETSALETGSFIIRKFSEPQEHYVVVDEQEEPLSIVDPPKSPSIRNESVVLCLEHPEVVESVENVEPSTSTDQDPKNFEEKKEKFGRDPKKLYEVYQKEWERLERKKASVKKQDLKK